MSTSILNYLINFFKTRGYVGLVPDPTSEGSLIIEEYKSCRELIGRNIEIIEKNEVFVVGACGAVFIYSLSASSHQVATLTSWLPVIISILGYIRYYGLDKTISFINDYLMALERGYPSLGWTGFYRFKNQDRILKRTRQLFWIVLFVICVVFTVVTNIGILPQTVKADTDKNQPVSRVSFCDHTQKTQLP